MRPRTVEQELTGKQAEGLSKQPGTVQMLGCTQENQRDAPDSMGSK